MKNIVMVQGIGINERGWAEAVSIFGRVTLIQVSFGEHVEIWEHRRLIYMGPEIPRHRTNRFDAYFFGLLNFSRAVTLVLRHAQGKKIDILLAGAPSTGLACWLLQRLGKAQSFIIFIIDYLPLRGPFWIRFHRWSMGKLAEFVARRADQVWVLSPRIPHAAVNPKNFVVPVPINESARVEGARAEVVYIGYPSEDHALEILFEICKRHQWKLNIIGDSPYLQSIISLAPPGTVFHGVQSDNRRIQEVIVRCFCGYAVYLCTGPASYSYYGFPSKTLAYLSNDTPFVTTDTNFFSAEFERFQIARVVEPQMAAIEEAMLQIRAHYSEFAEAIRRFRKDWNSDSLKFHQDRFTELGYFENDELNNNTQSAGKTNTV